MTGRGDQRGFVLPSVLAYIAAFMLIVVLSAGALQRARSGALELAAQGSLQAALDNIEAQALYIYLTSTPVPGGAEVFRRPPADATAVVMGDPGSPDDAPDPGPANIWSASDGSLMLTSGAITGRVQYRDVGGLVSLNASHPEIISRLLRQFGVSGEDAAGLAATLRDYTDEDSIRRPRGAEAADYRMRQRPVPTNSPLRDLAELDRVLGWDDLEFTGRTSFISLVTVSMTGPEPRWAFSPPEIATLETGPDDAWRADNDPVAMADAGHTLPGPRARLTLTVLDPASASGRMRIIEIERQSAGLAAPYSRRLVHEAPYRPSGDDPFYEDINMIDPFSTGDPDG